MKQMFYAFVNHQDFFFVLFYWMIDGLEIFFGIFGLASFLYIKFLVNKYSD